MPDRTQAMTLTGGLLAALGASVCCAGPLVVLMLGIGGSWVSGMTAFAPYQPVFIVGVIAAFGWAGWKLYRPAPSCEPGSACAEPKIRLRRQIAYWSAAAVALTLTTSSYWIPWLMT